MKKSFLAVSLLTLLSVLAGHAPTQAEIPNTINYQGSLKQTDGTPVDGSVSMTFTLYDSLTGDTDLWSDIRDVIVSNGIYSVVLGSPPGQELDLAFDIPYFLEVSVAGAALAPRQALTSVPYAQKAAGVEGLTVSNGRVGINTPSVDGGLLKIGDLEQGDSASFMFKNNWFGLSGAQGSDRYPYITFSDEHGEQVMYLGHGSKQSQYLDFAVTNDHTLQFRGEGDFLRVADFTAGAKILIGVREGTKVMRVKPVWGSTEGLALTSRTDEAGVFVDANTGNVGIGTLSPASPLHVKTLTRSETAERVGTLRFEQGNLILGNANGTDAHYPRIEWRRNGIRGAYLGWGVHQQYVQLQLDQNNNFAIMGGKVGIGTTTPQYTLDVNGAIRTRNDVIVDTDGANWPDYVFDEQYDLLPLEAVADYVARHKHLPGVPTQTDVAEQGLPIGQMQTTLLQKVEELTLHAIALKAENSRMKAEFERRLEVLEAAMNRNK